MGLDHLLQSKDAAVAAGGCLLSTFEMNYLIKGLDIVKSILGFCVTTAAHVQYFARQ